jgi:sugar/nucleoside kinase (ribokinase family)
VSLVVVGSVALDSVATPFDSRDDILGGSASFVSIVGSLVTRVRLVAVVGEDFPEQHVELLASRGADLTGLQRAAGRTFRWKGRYLDNMVGRETLDTQLNVFEDFDPVLPETYRDTPYLFLANIHPELQLKVLDQMSRPKLVATDTMNFWISGALEPLKRVLARTDLLLINDEETQQLSGEQNLLKAAEAVRAMGPSSLVVKRGDAGAMLFDEAGIFWAPAFPLQSVVDPTGAGDTFAGGLLSYLAARDQLNPTELRRAMIYGSSVASFCVEDFSVDRLKTLTTGEVLERCQGFAELVRFEDVTL